MPQVSRWMIRGSMGYLVAALLLALLPSSALRPLMLHLLTVGWATQLIWGVVFWMFPTPRGSSARGRQPAMWVAAGALNAGLLLRAAEPLPATGPLLRVALGASALLQLLAALAFVWAAWPRVRGK